MNHPPKQLALLISLIGAGVSPYAHARVEEQPQRTLPVLPGITCSEAEAAALPACANPPELAWQPQRSVLDLSGTPGVLVLYSASRDDWAPGEVPTSETGFDSPVEASMATRTDAPVPSFVEPRTSIGKGGTGKRKIHRVHVLARVAAKVKFDAIGVERIAPLQLAGAVVASTVPATPIVAEHAPETESPSAQVLRNLEAILSDQRDEVGAIKPEAASPVASTESAKVLAMLQGIAPPPAEEVPPVEDGPAKRLRKLAARAAKAEAKAAADAVAAGVVDVMLPLELPTFAALSADAMGAAAALMEPAPIPIGAPADPGKRTNPFGDKQVAVAATSLDRVRGGFSGEGLNISFGIERAVYINGALVTSTTLNVTDLGQAVAGRGVTTLDAGTVALIQNGSGNSVATGSISPNSIGTVIQNTLDGQKIQNITVINATANSLGIYRGLNLGSSLRGAVIDSLRR